MTKKPRIPKATAPDVSHIEPTHLHQQQQAMWLATHPEPLNGPAGCISCDHARCGFFEEDGGKIGHTELHCIKDRGIPKVEQNPESGAFRKRLHGLRCWVPLFRRPEDTTPEETPALYQAHMAAAQGAKQALPWPGNTRLPRGYPTRPTYLRSREPDAPKDYTPLPVDQLFENHIIALRG